MNILRRAARPTARLTTAVFVALALALGPQDSSATQTVRKGGKKLSFARAFRTLQPQDHECNHFGAASCPSTTVTGALTSADCVLNDNSLVDLIQFHGIAGQTVTIDLTSSAFDTYLFLLDQAPEVVAQNDDIEPGTITDSRLSHTLGSTGTWTIGVTSFGPSQTGAYTLTLQCTGAPPPAVCVADATTLCLNGGRFQVRMAWETPNGQSGQGNAVAETSDTGMFWFFSPNNVEAILKVVNGCSFNERYWVFAAGLTNVAVTATVIDTRTGVSRVYTNSQGTAFAPIQDTTAFPTCP